MAIFNSYFDITRGYPKYGSESPKVKLEISLEPWNWQEYVRYRTGDWKITRKKPSPPMGLFDGKFFFWWPLIGQVFLGVDGCGLLLGDILYYIVLYYIVLHYITLYIYKYYILFYYIILYICVCKYSHFQTTWELIVWGCDWVMLGWWHYVRYCSQWNAHYFVVGILGKGNLAIGYLYFVACDRQRMNQNSIRLGWRMGNCHGSAESASMSWCCYGFIYLITPKVVWWKLHATEVHSVWVPFVAGKANYHLRPCARCTPPGSS